MSPTQPPDDGRPVEDDLDGFLAGLDPAAAPGDNLELIVAELARVLGLAGASVSALSDDVSRGPLAWSSTVAQELEAEQFARGEGPCLEAFARREVVTEPSLADAGRWPMFTPTALGLGVEAVDAFPLGIGGQVIGALDLYRSEKGALSPRERDACVLIAEVLAQLAVAVAGDLPSGALPRSLDEVAQDRAEVHQAAGMTAVQLDVGVGEAMDVMRTRIMDRRDPPARPGARDPDPRDPSDAVTDESEHTTSPAGDAVSAGPARVLVELSAQPRRRRPLRQGERPAALLPSPAAPSPRQGPQAARRLVGVRT